MGKYTGPAKCNVSVKYCAGWRRIFCRTPDTVTV